MAKLRALSIFVAILLALGSFGAVLAARPVQDPVVCKNLIQTIYAAYWPLSDQWCTVL